MGFFKKLKRRHVVQVGIAYLVIAWGIAQVADLVLDSFDTPAWFMRLLLIVLASGFPVVLILAWIYTLRAGRLRRESEPTETLTAAPVEGITASPHPVEHESIAVLPFVNMSSDAEQEYFSDGIAEELLNLLARIPELLRTDPRWEAFADKAGISSQRLDAIAFDVHPPRRSGGQYQMTS